MMGDVPVIKTKEDSSCQNNYEEESTDNYEASDITDVISQQIQEMQDKLIDDEI